ncbi:beta-N-acetylhexosaminidase [Cohaesibacter celericrescens]|uniref:beta-N-acetylhexosaminidase n=1 Tax=Cohaesibacter celericrescens TaxID=2067669 RepID=UPI003567C4BA
MNANSNLVLKSLWEDDGSNTGRMRLTLSGECNTVLPDRLRLAYTAITRIPPDTELIGARFVSRTANYHELAPLGPLCADAQGVLWEIVIPVLSHRPNHCTDGPKSAFLILSDGNTVPVHCEPLQPQHPPVISFDQQSQTNVVGNASKGRPMLGLLPCANDVQIDSWAAAAPDCFSLQQPDQAANAINALCERLFSAQSVPFASGCRGMPIIIEPAGDAVTSHGEAAYALLFSHDAITLQADKAGLFYGLLALAQIWRAARGEGGDFSFPLSGRLVDWPQHNWRGMHLDVSRQFYNKQSIEDFLDILAWHRFNRFHWHFTDDEGWRLESPAYPGLTRVGAWRGHKLPLLPQHGSGVSPYGGFYSQQDVREILAHAEDLHIDVMPEVDVPGHCQSALVSIPELLDPSAIQGGASVQGYVNNALNPGLNATWTFLETVFGEICDLFPGRFVHMGGDEVAESAWTGSRAANSWAQAKGYLDAAGKPDTMHMQAAVLRFVEDRLVKSGKVPVAWEEAAKGGGLDPDKSILMAWMKAERGVELAQKGYRIIMCPGEAYYLDMAQSPEWTEPGLSWAGTASPYDAYQFDPAAGFENSPQMIGIQGCIWSENLVSRSLFNHMVFPRLSAVAESAWSKPEQKDWHSFFNRVALMPKMPPEIL